MRRGGAEHVQRSFELAAARRSGKAATVKLDVRLVAGQTADARPSSQWLILPPLEEDTVLTGVRLPGAAQGLGMPALTNEASMWR